MRIKQATILDIDTISSIHSKSWKNAYRGILSNEYLDTEVESEHISLWQKRLSSEDQTNKLILLAYKIEIPVGFMCVVLGGDRNLGSCLDNLHVLPDYRGQRIGLRLFVEAARWTRKEQMCQLMHLWVLEENYKARSFYNSLQGKIVDRKLSKFGQCEVPVLCYLWDNLSAITEIGSSF